MIEKYLRTLPSRILIPSSILWGVAIIAFLASITARNPEFARMATMTLREFIAVLFIWHTLVAIFSKGTFRFDVGFCVTFALILFLKHAYQYDPSDKLGQWINGLLPKVKVITGDTATFQALHYNSTRDGSLLLLSAVGGVVALRMDNLADTQQNNQPQ